MRYTVENKKYEYFVGQFKKLEPMPHIHTHLEMIYLLEGKARGAVDGKWFDMEAGDLFLAAPNQVHQYGQEGDIAFVLVIFSANMDGELSELLKDKTPLEAVVRKECLPVDLARQLQDIAHLMRAELLHQRLEAKGRFLVLLGRILPLFAYRPDAGADMDSVKTVLTYCSQHCTEPITLSSVARELHLSKFYISHFFRQRMDMGFTEFVNRLRVDRARELLDGSRSMTEVAFDCGFSSIRTFNRVFRATAGMTPRDYVRQTMEEI